VITIPWGNFGIVAGTVLVATLLLTAFYSGGVRLLETDGGGAGGVRRAGAYVCFAICIAAVLFGLWVIIPQFH
jgi:hypothetical protein